MLGLSRWNDHGVVGDWGRKDWDCRVWSYMREVRGEVIILLATQRLWEAGDGEFEIVGCDYVCNFCLG